jgi:hypothetical protein
MIDTSPTSRGGATAYLSSGRGWRVWHHHIHRAHSAEARLVLQAVGVGGVPGAVTVTDTAIVTKDRVQRRGRRTRASAHRLGFTRFLVARRGLASWTISNRIRSLQRMYLSSVGLIRGGADGRIWIGHNTRVTTRRLCRRAHDLWVGRMIRHDRGGIGNRLFVPNCAKFFI